MVERRFIPPHERRSQLPPPRARVSNETGKTDTGRTPYQLGKGFEGAVRGRLRRRGYFVLRAYASKGVVDLLAVGPATAAHGVSGLFIQAKRRGIIGSVEWNALYETAEAHAGWPVVVMKLSERTVGFYRLDAPREPRKRGRPWTMFDPRDLSEMIPPPTLLDKEVA